MSAFEFPPQPSVPAHQESKGTSLLRYEDVSQEGTLKVCAMPHVLGSMFFRTFWKDNPIGKALLGQGVVPILSRLTLESLQSPISVRTLLQCDGAFSLGTLHDEAGAVHRLLMNMDAELRAPRGRTHPPQPEGAGEVILVGRVHAEHVFTRPFGPSSERKVTRVEQDGMSLVPDTPVINVRPAELLQLPEGSSAVEPDFVMDPVPHAFGLVHTDSNQHVNSLVYPLLFEEALVRRIAALGGDTRGTLVQYIDLAFRKPCFAGDRVQLWLRSFTLDGRKGAVAYLAPEGLPPERAHVTCRMWTR